jgi:hypothetical protein
MVRRLLSLLDECMQHDNPTSHDETVESAADSRPTSRANFEEAVTKRANNAQAEDCGARVGWSGADGAGTRVVFESRPGIRNEAARAMIIRRASSPPLHKIRRQNLVNAPRRFAIADQSTQTP